jgi:hypothetical protein
MYNYRSLQPKQDQALIDNLCHALLDEDMVNLKISLSEILTQGLN